MPDKRPETIDDLPNYMRVENLLNIEITEAGLKNGILRAADSAIESLINAYGANSLTVKFTGLRLAVDRPLTDDELTEALTQHQHVFDITSEYRNRQGGE